MVNEIVTTAGVRCPQLVYTSAPRVLSGSGFGVLAHSAGWPPELGTDARGLGSLVSFPAAAGRVEPDDVYGLVRRGPGALLFRKAVAPPDSFGRRGNYLVHLVWDPSGTLTARELPGLLTRPVEQLTSLAPTTELEEAVLSLSAPVRLQLDDDDWAAAAAAVTCLLDGADVTLPDRLPSGRPTVDVVFDLVPRGLLVDLSCSGESDGHGDTATTRVRLDPAVPWELSRSPIAELTVAAARAGRLPDDARSVGELEEQLHVQEWVTRPPEELTGSQVEAVLASAEAEQWLVFGGARAALLLLAGSGVLQRRLDRMAAASPRVAEELRVVGLDLLYEALARGTTLPRRAAATAGLRHEDVAALLGDLQLAGERIARLDDTTAEIVETVLLAEAGLHALALLPLDQLPELVTRPGVAELVLRDLPTTEGLPRGLAAAALVAADAGSVEALDGVLAEEELVEVLGRAAELADHREQVDALLTAALQLRPGRGLALRAVLLRCPLSPEERAEILLDRWEDLLLEDDWPVEMVRLVDLRRRPRRISPPWRTARDSR